MSLDIHQREREGVTILDIEGRLVLGEEASALGDYLSRLTASGAKLILLNCADVPYIDSSGLGMLVTWSSRMERTGGALKLLNLSQRNLELMVITKLSTVFAIFQDEKNAIDSFFPDREVQKFDILSFVKSNPNPTKS